MFVLRLIGVTLACMCLAFGLYAGLLAFTAASMNLPFAILAIVSSATGATVIVFAGDMFTEEKSPTLTARHHFFGATMASFGLMLFILWTEDATNALLTLGWSNPILGAVLDAIVIGTLATSLAWIGDKVVNK